MRIGRFQMALSKFRRPPPAVLIPKKSAPAEARARVQTGDGISRATSGQIPISQQFRTLDEYLAHLERMQAPVDGAWYKQVAPGVYELQTGNLRTLTPGKGKTTFTREELERQFGFRK